jgi:hypothetical protein
MSTEVHFDEPVNQIIVIPKDHHRNADFIIGKYTINLDLRHACCEKYYIYVNGKDFTVDANVQRAIINIEQSNSVVFAFGEKQYHDRGDWNYQKNFMTIKFAVTIEYASIGMHNTVVVLMPTYILDACIWNTMWALKKNLD